MTPGSRTDERLRAAVLAHLDRLAGTSVDGSLRSADINTFTFDGTPVRLIGQTGIRKPAGLDAALTITTTYSTNGDQRPYDDNVGPEGMIRYKYRGIDPNHSDNRALRQAMVAGVPLAYFVGVAKGVYVPIYPVWILEETASAHEFTVAVDEGQRLVNLFSLAEPQRAYVTRLTKARLHQPVFRARVLRAYTESCAMCRRCRCTT